NGTLTTSAKTNQSFVTLANKTLEFRVDVLNARPPTPDTNALAVLAWVPTNTTIAAGGYSLMVGAADLKIMRGATVLLATNSGFQNTNITMVIRLTPSGTAVNINVRLYKRQDAGANLFYEQTVT